MNKQGSKHNRFKNKSSPYRIALVQTSDRIANNILLPLAIGVLWATANGNKSIREKWQLDSIVYEPNEIEITSPQLSHCDLVCFSTYSWNVDYHLSLATAIKQLNPNCTTVFGGPHFSSKWPDFWNQYKNIVDLVLLGEGEESFQQLLLSFPDQDKMKNVPGSWSCNHLTEIAPRVRLENYDESPYLQGFYDEIITSCQHRGLILQATLQTNRGCPYRCSFCEEGAEYKNKIYQYNLDRVLREIEWCGQKQIEYLNIADDNFGILERDIDIMEKICATSLKYGYPKILDATYAKNSPTNVLEIARLDKKYGTNLIRGITVALQSQNPTTLTKIRRFNLVEKKQNKFLWQLKQLQVPTYAEIIWPLPFETFDSLCTGVDQIIAQGLDNWIGLYPLSMQPSADLYHDFHKHYKFVKSSFNDSNSFRSHIKMHNPFASDWADHEHVVRGHVFYMWLVTLYFFGFARPLIDCVRSTMTVSQAINDIMDRIDELDEGHKVKTQHNKLKDFWSNWLKYKNPPQLSQFHDQNTDFWYPYTHHASWCQINYQLLLNFLTTWLKQKGIYTKVNKLALDQCKNSAVRFGRQYPYTHDQSEITLSHDQPDFPNIFEFCRFYYWFNRKKAYSRTVITKL